MWGVSEYYDEDTQTFVACGPDTELYWVSEATPMGWSWAHYFAQEALAEPVRLCLASLARSGGEGPRVPLPPSIRYGGLLEDRRPAPLLAHARPLGAVYVDNALIVGATAPDTRDAVAAIRRELDKVGLVVGDHSAEPPRRLRGLRDRPHPWRFHGASLC